MSQQIFAMVKSRQMINQNISIIIIIVIFLILPESSEFQGGGAWPFLNFSLGFYTMSVVVYHLRACSVLHWFAVDVIAV